MKRYKNVTIYVIMKHIMLIKLLEEAQETYMSQRGSNWFTSFARRLCSSALNL